MNFSISVDSLEQKQVDKILSTLTHQEIKKVIQVAARYGIKEITNEARENLKREIKPSKTMLAAINIVPIEEDDFVGARTKAKISRKYYDSYKLRFFEGGTEDRYHKKTKKWVGKIKATHFFENAVNSKKQIAIDKFKQSIDQYLDKIQK